MAFAGAGFSFGAKPAAPKPASPLGHAGAGATDELKTWLTGVAGIEAGAAATYASSLPVGGVFS